MTTYVYNNDISSTNDIQVSNTEAMQIITKLRQGWSLNQIFNKAKSLGILHGRIKIKQTLAEINRLESEILSKMNGNYQTGVDGEGNPVYFIPTTKQALIDSLSSDFITIATLVDDVIAWDRGVYDADRTWEEYKALF